MVHRSSIHDNALVCVHFVQRLLLEIFRIRSPYKVGVLGSEYTRFWLNNRQLNPPFYMFGGVIWSISTPALRVINAFSSYWSGGGGGGEGMPLGKMIGRFTRGKVFCKNYFLIKEFFLNKNIKSTSIWTWRASFRIWPIKEAGLSQVCPFLGPRGPLRTPSSVRPPVRPSVPRQKF